MGAFREPIYRDVAPFYDRLLRHVDYTGWYQYLLAAMNKFRPEAELILELGCGSGRFGSQFSAGGYRIIGMDNSHEMLAQARKRAKSNFSVFCADMRTFSLSRSPDFIFCVHDTMNYFHTKREFRAVLANIRKNMGPGSVFLFDVTTEFNIEQNFNNNAAFYEMDGVEIEWSNRYNKRKKIVVSALTFMDSNGERIEEHMQRIYSADEVRQMLRQEGFGVIALYGDQTFAKPRNDSIMINFVTAIEG